MSDPTSHPSELIHATYRLRADATQAEQLARFIAYEQTVELPERLITSPHLLDNVVGKVEALDADGPDHFRAQIAYNAELASGQLGQLVNLLYGNVSMGEGIRLVGVDLPPSVLARSRVDARRYNAASVDASSACSGVAGCWRSRNNTSDL